jgi:hypothetical protein
MRSAARKTAHKHQLDLPLDQARLDPPSSVHSVSSSSRTEVTPDLASESFVATPIACQPDRSISFPIEHAPVVPTLPDEHSRETKPPTGLDIDTNRNLYHSLGRTEQDAATSGTKLTVHGVMAVLDLLRRLDAARGHDRGQHAHDDRAAQRGSHSADPVRGPENRSDASVAPGAPGTPRLSGGITDINGSQ